jgi:hypothetical protein
MESQEQQQAETQGDESPEEFAEQVENDPSTAQSEEGDQLEEVRGG